MRYFLPIILGACFLWLPSTTQAAPKGMAVIELFTSPFCNDTPAADQTFASIAKDNDPNIITLSCHITYLNRGTYTDPLSDKFCDARQTKYFTALKLKVIETPQVIINGRFDTIGTVEKTVRAGAKMVQSMKTAQPLSLELHENTLNLELPKMNLDSAMDVWLFSYDKTRNIEFPAESETDPDVIFNYSNTTISIKKLMTWDGSYRTMSYPFTGKEAAADGYAILIQHQDQSDIIAAGKVER